jgi:hypothetical protein
MRIILDPLDAEDAFQVFLANLQQDCRAVTAQMSWRGTFRESEAQVNDRFGFWFSHRRTTTRHWLQLGLAGSVPSQAPAGVLVPVVEASFPLCGFDRRMNGFFLRFGNDILVAQAARPGDAKGGDAGLANFLQRHGYDLTSHAVPYADASPETAPLETLILSSVSSPALAFNIYRFVSAVNDFQQWSAQGLMPSGQKEFFTGSRPPAGGGVGAGTLGTGAGAFGLQGLVEEGVREQLVRHIKARKLGLKLGWTLDGDLALASPDHIVLAALLVGTSLDPAALFGAVGKLILSRSTLRAAKFLVVPGVLGPYFTQTLFRHDIHVATYKLTQDMAVVLDTDVIFKAIQTVG